jgi:hypothetical protein
MIDPSATLPRELSPRLAAISSLPYPTYRQWWEADQARKKASSYERKRVAYEEKRREDLRRNSASYRLRKRAMAIAERDGGLPSLLEEIDLIFGVENGAIWPSTDLIQREVRQFRDWLTRGGRVQAQYKKRRHELMRSRIALLFARGDLGRDPSFNVFAQMLRGYDGGDWTKDTARARLMALHRLEGPDGPWDEVYP